MALAMCTKAFRLSYSGQRLEIGSHISIPEMALVYVSQPLHCHPSGLD